MFFYSPGREDKRNHKLDFGDTAGLEFFCAYVQYLNPTVSLFTASRAAIQQEKEEREEKGGPAWVPVSAIYEHYLAQSSFEIRITHFARTTRELIAQLYMWMTAFDR